MTKIKYIFATFLVLGIFSLPTTNSFAEAIKKPQKPTIEKLVLDDQVYKKENQIDIKDKTISYKLRGSIPEINKFQTYKYVFCDILPNDTSLDKESIKIYLITEKNKTNITNMFELEDKGDTFKLISVDIKPFIKEPSKIEVLYNLNFKGKTTKDLVNYANIEYQDGKTVDDMATTRVKRETLINKTNNKSNNPILNNTNKTEQENSSVPTGDSHREQKILGITLILISLGVALSEKPKIGRKHEK